ncbi:phage tail family protein [Streptomyces sp. ME02-7008A-1]|uniref:phage distal tail protein n=1 Tax=unclassified Streptomyces TaxID=2593676 RepID=UPI0029AC05AB|nr:MULTISPECIES: phage tail domain-containing protein [unclassified Streptomyces]MDX3183483.1 phage tail family protein [Streptomyces sp. ME02-7008A-1]MDX3303935.1 phage tail family protein [Streptomyces sp. ME02-7008A]
MPILVASTSTPEPQPPWEWPKRLIEMPRVSFTDPGGTVTMLTDWERGWLVQPGAKGLDMPSYAMATDQSPGIDGYEVRQVRAEGKTITLPIAFWANDSRAAYKARRRALIRSLNPKRGQGTLTLTEPDGATRSIGVRYTDGMEGDESLDAAGARWCITALVFAVPSPYWNGGEVTTEWKNGTGGDFYPFLPLTVGDSQVLGSVTVDNDGDDDAFPIWIIKGPATSATLTNVTTGQTLVLTRTLTASDTVVIDTRERRQTALLNGVTNLWPHLSDSSTLWPLELDRNELTLTIAGSTSATSVRMTYQPRYLAA